MLLLAIAIAWWTCETYDPPAEVPPSALKSDELHQSSCLTGNFKQLWSSSANFHDCRSWCTVYGYKGARPGPGLRWPKNWCLFGLLISSEFFSASIRPHCRSTAWDNSQTNELPRAFDNKYITFYASSFSDLAVTLEILSATDSRGFSERHHLGSILRINSAMLNKLKRQH